MVIDSSCPITRLQSLVGCVKRTTYVFIGVFHAPYMVTYINKAPINSHNPNIIINA